MTTAPHLRVVDPTTGELHEGACPGCTTRDEQIHGLRDTIDMQARKLGNLARKLEADADTARHPKGKEIVALIERWKKATGHERAKVSKDRIDMVKARLKDQYDFDQMEFSVDGLGAFPYVRNGKRVREGTPAERHDRLGIALGGGESLEKFANLGALARKRGWVTWV